MTIPTPPPLPNVILASDHDPGALRAAVAAGVIRRADRGVYLPTDDAPAWQAARDEHLARCVVISNRLGDSSVISHVSAAAVHGLWVPSVRSLPVQVSQPFNSREAAGRAGPATRHRARLTSGDFVTVNGIRVTSIRRTVLDCARTLPADWALAVTDSGMRVCIAPDRQQPDDALARARQLQLEWLGHLLEMCSPRGRVQARAVVSAANPLSESPYESRARCFLLAAGLPAPTLQREVETPLGTFYTDMSWAWTDGTGTRRVLHLEMDGAVKYQDSADLFAEKRREDSIRSASAKLLRAVPEDLRAGARELVRRVSDELPAGLFHDRPWQETRALRRLPA